MKNIGKSVRSRLPAGFIPFLIYTVLRGLYATLRISYVGAEVPDAFHRRDKGIIQVLWHSRLVIGPLAYRGKKIHVLASSHGDGEIIARVVRLFNCGIVRGSSSKGGKEALRTLVSLARQNIDLGVTPDGPRGPAEVVKPGVAQLARLTGVPVIPFAFASSAAKSFRSWDRFIVPYPFSRCAFVWGEALVYREGEDLEAFRRRVEEGLTATTARADSFFCR